MSKRITIFFSVLMISFCFIIINVYRISTGTWLCDTALNQSSYKITVAKLRGLIYDYKKRPLVGLGEKDLFATVLPSIESANKINKAFPREDSEKILSRFSSGIPFKLKLTRGISESNDIKIFDVPRRYSKKQLLPHIIGYLDSNGNGVSGIESSYNDILNECGAEISVRYKIDALGRALKGEKAEVDNTSYLQTKGVVLTIDKDIQEITKSAAEKYMKKGAVIVTEVPSCKIRACISIPEFCPLRLENDLNNNDSPFINRAFSSYNIGSIFKLVTCAAALEAGIPSSFSYNCCGHMNVDGTIFHCFNGGAHNLVDMNCAIKYSCNTYFIELCNQIKPRLLLELSKKFGLGKEIELAPGLVTAKGNFPSIRQLKNKSVLANISFGQGSLMVTPLQTSAIINTISSGGIYSTPRLIEGFVNQNLEFIEENSSHEEQRVILKETADYLKEFMHSSVEGGTSAQGKPQNNSAGAKTATAETGVVSGNHHVIQAWYAGFYPYGNPKYSIVVLAEDGVGGGGSCGPVFKMICDNLNI